MPIRGIGVSSRNPYLLLKSNQEAKEWSATSSSSQIKQPQQQSFSSLSASLKDSNASTVPLDFAFEASDNNFKLSDDETIHSSSIVHAQPRRNERRSARGLQLNFSFGLEDLF